MANVRFSYKNFSDSGTLSGGSWETNLPLTNLQSRVLSKYARTTTTSASSTTFSIDLGSDRYPVKTFGIFKHNYSTNATYRIIAGSSAGASNLYDSGTLDVWPTVYLPEDLEWEDDNFWLGTIASADIDGYPINLIHDTEETVRARYWTFISEDTNNANGYVQFGRLWIGNAWSPQINYSYNPELEWEARSQFDYSLGGNIYFDDRPSARIFSFALDSINETEAYGTLLDIQRVVKNSNEIVLIADPDDATRGFKRNFLGRLRRMDPIRETFFKRHTAGFEVEEIL